MAKYLIKNYDESKSDFETLNNNDKFPSIANFYLGNIAIIDKDRELAIKYWLKADEYKNENAKLKLDLFHTYTGNYLLKKDLITKKLTDFYSLFFNGAKYIGGLAEIDKNENVSKLKTKLIICENGLKIELWKNHRTYYIGIAYYEIENINYRDTQKLFELHLVDKKVLTFSYDQTKDYSNGLKKLCDGYKQSTGKTPDAASLWKD
jgi:hypothetical protein